MMFTGTPNFDDDLSALLANMSFPPPAEEDTSAWPWASDAFNSPFHSPYSFKSLELPSTTSVDNVHAQPNFFAEQWEFTAGSSEDPTSLELRATVREVSPSPVLHVCRRLPNTDNETLDSWLKTSDVSEPRVYICTWADCLAQPFEGKCKARIHVRKHLGIKKLYECSVCYKQFVSQGTAKRHTETQQRAFSCKICHSEFARKDYWRVHERRCAKRHLIEELDHGS